MNIPWMQRRKPKPARALAVQPVTTGARPMPRPMLADPRKGVSSIAVENTALRKPGGAAEIPPLVAYSLPKPAPGVVPAGEMAMDDMSNLGATYNWALQGLWAEGLGFLGYPYLAELTQRPEYRRASEITAKEMTRRWISLSTTAKDTKGTEKLKELDKALKKHKVQKLFRGAAQQDGFYGRSQLYVGMKNARVGDKERRRPLILDPRKVDKGSLDYFRLVEPYWSYPGMFNADRPLERDFYKPETWFVMSDQVHSSRLLLFVGREMPDILKPAYQFGGMSLTQMGKPYVDNWLNTRQNVADIVQAFSVMVLSTDMSQVMSGDGGASLMNRLAMFNNLRNNNGTFAIDKDTEEFQNISAPITGLHELQAQVQEHMSSVWGIPLVVLLGIDPSGLNASSEGSLKVYYDYIEAMQESLFRENLTTVLRILQLDLWGEIDEEIDFTFNPLWVPTEAERGELRKQQAETDKIYLDCGVLDPDEVRERIANEDNGLYSSLDLSGGAPGPPEPLGDPADEGDPSDDDDEGGEGGEGDAPPKEKDPFTATD